MASVRVQAADFDIGAETRALTEGRADIGAIGSFLGTVRDIAGGRRITAMTLEHYPGMTERSMARIAAEAEGRIAPDAELPIDVRDRVERLARPDAEFGRHPGGE